MEALNRPALLAMPDATSSFFHDLSETHFVLQEGKLTAQAWKQLNENAFYARVEWLTVAIEQSCRSQVLHDASVFAVEKAGHKASSKNEPCYDARRLCKVSLLVRVH
jgi:hypothetical protein